MRQLRTWMTMGLGAATAKEHKGMWSDVVELVRAKKLPTIAELDEQTIIDWESALTALGVSVGGHWPTACSRGEGGEVPQKAYRGCRLVTKQAPRPSLQIGGRVAQRKLLVPNKLPILPVGGESTAVTIAQRVGRAHADMGAPKD